MDVQEEKGGVEIASEQKEGVREEGRKERFEEGSMQGVGINVENEDGRKGRNVEGGSHH